MQREHRILNRRGEAYSPTPLLYTIDEALCSRKGTLDSLNMSLPELAPILTPTTATPLPVSAVDWERIKKFRSILQAECMETCSRCKERWFQMGLATEGDNMGVCKACIKDADSLKDLTFPPLFGESNGLDLRSVSGQNHPTEPDYLAISKLARATTNNTNSCHCCNCCCCYCCCYCCFVRSLYKRSLSMRRY